MNLIFDFDGTICDSYETVLGIANDFLVKHNKPPIRTDEIEEYRNKGLKKIISERKISKLKIAKLIIDGRKKMSKYIPRLRSFDGLPEVLEKLSKKHKLAILTSNSKDNVEVFLKKHNLDKSFDFIHSESDLFGKHKKLKKAISKYSFNSNETYYIGDETRDVEAAKKAGVKSVAVVWGYESKEVLKNANPDLLVSNPKELLRI